MPGIMVPLCGRVPVRQCRCGMLQSCGCRLFSFLSDLLRWFGQGLLTTAVNIFRSRNLSEKTRFRAVFPRFLEERGRDTIHEGISLTVVRLRNIAVFPGFLAITRMFTAVVWRPAPNSRQLEIRR